ncbi:MAG: hypothetical protein H3C31_05760 [Brumimicrobium sp.]|nr:hypothetical protein [Brumimicrobium sp.]MCO5267390.1 hypothetical protein [Brumimicrobium sp.]
MKKYIITAGIFVFLFGMIATISSCRKKADTIAQITVRDTAKALVSGARVILYGTSTTDPIQAVVRRDTAYTNSSGVATFNYNDVYQLGQAGVAVLNIRAEKGALYGNGIIKITEEQENYAKVFIKP